MKQLVLFLWFFFLLFGSSPSLNAQDNPALSVTGLVKKPAFYSSAGLRAFKTEETAINEEGRPLSLSGIPLKALVELSEISSEGRRCEESSTLALRLKSRSGGTLFLSWDEVVRSPAAAYLLTQGGAGSETHSGGASDAFGLKKGALTRLLIEGAGGKSRYFDELLSIELVEICPSPPEEGSGAAACFTIREGDRSQRIHSLDGLERASVKPHLNGVAESGVPLAALLALNRFDPDENTILILSGADGQRLSISGHELLHSPRWGSIVVAETSSVGRGGRCFAAVLPDGGLSPSGLNPLVSVELIRYKKEAALLVVGVGPGDSSHISLEGLSAIGSADCFVASEDIVERFGSYMGGKRVLFDPLASRPYALKKKNPGMGDKEIMELASENERLHSALLKKSLVGAETVCFLEYGDPTLYGSWIGWIPGIVGRVPIRIVPGISSFNAASAMMGWKIAYSGSVVLTMPGGIYGNERLVAATAQRGETLVIFSGLEEIDRLLPILLRYYPEDTPALIVYRAGYAAAGRAVPVSLKTIKKEIEANRERHLGLIYIGPVAAEGLGKKNTR